MSARPLGLAHEPPDCVAATKVPLAAKEGDRSGTAGVRALRSEGVPPSPTASDFPGPDTAWGIVRH